MWAEAAQFPQGGVEDDNLEHFDLAIDGQRTAIELLDVARQVLKQNQRDQAADANMGKSVLRGTVQRGRTLTTPERVQTWWLAGSGSLRESVHTGPAKKGFALDVCLEGEAGAELLELED